MEVKVTTPALPNPKTNNYSDCVYNTVMRLWQGKSNNIGEFSIAAGATETQVSDSRLTNNSVVVFVGLDSGSEYGKLYLKERNGKGGYFVVGHPSFSTGHKYAYAVIG